MKSYGVTAAALGTADDDIALPLEELARNGVSLLEAALSPTTIGALRDALDRVLAAQTTRFGGESALTAIGESGLARALLEEHAAFLDILRVARLDAIVEAVLGPAALVMQQNGIVMLPDGQENHQQSWHRDLPYQSWTSTKPLALGALAILDDFTSQSGSTLFLPGSHRHQDFPSQAYIERWAWPAHAAAGTIVLFDAMCFHRGGVNCGNAPRRAVNTLFGIPLLAQQVAFTDRLELDAKLRRRLGIGYQPAKSVDAWRERRAGRLGART